MRFSFPLVTAFALVALAAPAAAHTGVATTDGFAVGLAHPLTGLDHLLAMVAVGLWAGLAGGRRLWFLPLGFVVAMAAGGVVGAVGVSMPAMELVIVGSVIALGAAVAAALAPPTVPALAAVAVFAPAHGVAHGAAMPATVDGLGFVLATIALHAAGIALARGLGRAGFATATRIGGGAIATTGVVLLVIG